MAQGLLEIHEHSHTRTGAKIKHSHAGTTRPHFGDYGPATLTIDRDEWARKTGLRGGGRKQYSRKPFGPQL